MRNISFMLTQQQIRQRTKTVTRRIGWSTLKAGDMLCGVEKGMGLKAGEKVKPLATIHVLSVRLEPLSAMTADLDYGIAECAKEGFGEHPSVLSPSEFVQFFCKSHRRCTPDTVVTRIEFEYVG
ncbi:hypothetical protein [Ralstonia pseudosolanacearum]|uniref:ASCH domain-containing protein n=1 Tax=Ralstonia pseudosolanacearum TaxID=1310165 RepID=A0A454TM45_9RALS|nr:hypothetical protein [Ralstonia pseudosolanacearum]RNM03207.1 hypothetical protein EGA29_19145 [Ralstonia pseudosolanacearum]